MLAAIMCVFIVTVLAAYALNSSLGSISATGQNRKSLQAIDAAEAGVQDEVGKISAAVKSGATTFSCPSGKQQVTLSNTGLANTANTASYTLKVSTGTTMPSSASACPAGGTLPVPSGVWDALVQAVGSTGAVIGGGTRTVAGKVAVTYQTVTKAQAESGQITLGGSPILSIPSSPVTATNSGGSSSVVSGPSTAALLPGETWLTAGALADYAEADWNGTSGTSYACSGLLSSSGATIKVGSPATSCTTSGNTGTGGVGIDISNIPELGTTLSSLLDLKLTMDAATAYATETTNGVPTGSASITNAKLTINLVGGLLNVTVPVTIPAGSDQNVLAAITTAVTNEMNSLGVLQLAAKTVLSTVVSLLNGTVASLVTLNSDEWQPSTSPTAGSQLSVSALYLSVLPGAGSGLLTANLGTAIVGGDTGTQIASLQSLSQSS